MVYRNMQSFGLWLISESVDDFLAKNLAVKNIIAKNKINPHDSNYIINLVLKRPEKEQIPYALYLLGFHINKSDARTEDYDRAEENYTFYRNNKQNLFPNFKDWQPFQLGSADRTISFVRRNEFSKTRMKKLGKQTDDIGMSRVIEEHFGEYTFYTIPKATMPQEIINNKQLYCKLGKGTDWCTAAPDGDYYQQYVDKLDITVIYEGGKPLYQFGLENDQVTGLCQFMDVKDNQVEFLDLDLYRHIENSKYKNILKLYQFTDMNRLMNNELSDSFILKKIQEFKYQKMIKNDPESFKTVENPSEELQEFAVRQSGRLLQYIKNPSYKIQKLALGNYGPAIKFISNPDKELQMTAVKETLSAIQFIEDPDEEVQLVVIHRNGEAIRYIKNPSEEAQKFALRKNGINIQYIKNPTKELELIAVKSTGLALQYIENPDDEIKEIAVKNYPYAIKFIDNPSVQLQKMAIKIKPSSINFIDNPSEAMKRFAVSLIDNPNDLL